jgi:hypothetical protein
MSSSAVNDFASKLTNLIHTHIPLTGKTSATGFQQIRCACCSDHSPRGGWKIEPSEIVYHCFNCGIASGWKLGDEKIRKDFEQILKAFGVPVHELNEIKSQLFFNQPPRQEDKTITLETLHKVNLYTPEVSLPEGSVRLDESHINECQFLLNKYRLTCHDYPFFVSTTLPNRVIIPFYKQSKVIYWQARTILSDERLRYRNCEVKKEAVIFNNDELFRYSEKPLFICEGVFDAIHVNGISLLGSKLTESKIELLRKSRRELVFVIDKDANGQSLAFHVLKEKLGSITFVTNPSTTKSKADISSRIVETGKIWTMYELLQNRIYDEKKAKLYINFLPKNTTRGFNERK